MSRWKPCKRNEFIRRLRKLGFDGPILGRTNQFMVFQQHRLTIPSNDEYSMPQLRMMVLRLSISLAAPFWLKSGSAWREAERLSDSTGSSCSFFFLDSDCDISPRGFA